MNASIQTDSESNTSVIAFLSPKGGTGKTLLLLESAYLIAASGARVLIVDTDIGTAGSTGFINSLSRNYSGRIPSFNGVNSLINQFNRWRQSSKPVDDRTDLTAVPLRVTIAENLSFDVITPYDLSTKWDIDLSFKYDSEPFDMYLDQTFALWRNKYDVIFVDLRGGLDPLARSIVRHANEILLVTVPGCLAAGQVDEVVNHLFIFLENDPTTRRLHIISNMADHLWFDRQETVEEIKTRVDRLIRDSKSSGRAQGLRLAEMAYAFKNTTQVRYLHARMQLPVTKHRLSLHTRTLLKMLDSVLPEHLANLKTKLKSKRLMSVLGKLDGLLYVAFESWHIVLLLFYLLVLVLLFFAPPPDGISWLGIEYTDIFLVSAIVPAIFSALALVHGLRRTWGRWRSWVRWLALLLLLPVIFAIGLFYDVAKTSQPFVMGHERSSDLERINQLEAKLTRDQNYTNALEEDLEQERIGHQTALEHSRDAEIKLKETLAKNTQLTDERDRVLKRNTALEAQIQQANDKLAQQTADIDRYAALNQERLEHLSNLRRIAETSIAAAAKDSGQALIDARRYIGAVLQRSVAQTEYAPVYDQWIRDIKEVDDGDPRQIRAAVTRDMRLLGITAFERGDLAWAYKLLTESYTLALPLHEAIDPTAPSYLYMLACHVLEPKEQLPPGLANLIEKVRERGVPNLSRGDEAKLEALSHVRRVLIGPSARHSFKQKSGIEVTL